ncbi:MAG: DNA internalization-related competence protein ComEC/Rec2, partial [Planctomycetaceae bacterium]
AAGIAIDRYTSLSWTPWILAGGVAIAAIAVLSRRHMRAAAVCAVLLFVALGGARHHLSWSLRPVGDIRQYAREAPQLVELIGVVQTPAEIDAAEHDAMTPPWMQVDRSHCVVAAESLISGRNTTPVVGLLRLDVDGHLLHARTGDRIRCVGTLAVPGPVRNPGAFDYRAWLRGQGVDCVVRCDHPDAVSRIEPAIGWRHALGRQRDRLRSEILSVMRRELSPQNSAVAASLLLGDRTGMTDEISDAFIDSGTMHLLAISGLHVGMLAGMVYLVCRLLKLSVTSTGLVVLLTIVAYAFVTDHRPPVVRSAILAGMVVVAMIGGRRAAPLNTLACSALAVLLWNPADLFDIGTQLSFLAVLGIISGARWCAALHRLPSDPLAPERSRWERGLRRGGRWLLDAYIITAAIWLFTLPISLHVFHLGSPIGFLVNVLLVPYSAVVLAAGFLLMGCGLLLPELAAIPGAVFESSLSLLTGIVRWSAATPLGHFHIAGPSGWWLAGWYGLLAIATGVIPWRWPTLRAWQGLGAWTVIGLAGGLTGVDRDGLACTVLSVGHGGAILLELPHGRTLLYDCGVFGAPERAERVVQHALWDADVSQVDGLVISHADSDHYNGTSGLMQSTRVATLLQSQASLDFRQGGMAALCDDAAAAGARVQLIASGDRLRVDPDVEIDVLHPPTGRGDDEDNANSIVLRVRYAGRTVLLTGDLEGAGLQSLISTPAQSIDVLLAPHHGATAANPRVLAGWCRPQVVVASTGDPARAEALRQTYGDNARVYSTANDGAVRVHIAPDGTLSTEGFLNR